MSSVLELVRNSPFGGPVSHAKCEGLKVNDQRTVAALAAAGGAGTDAIRILIIVLFFEEYTIADVLCRLQGQMSRRLEVLPKNRPVLSRPGYHLIFKSALLKRLFSVFMYDISCQC